VAIYHLSVKAISRSAGRSATAAAAYRAGCEIADERTGEVHDYRRKKRGIESADLILPPGAPAWASDRVALWNAAERAERRKDSCVAREYEVALPSELPSEARRALALSFAREMAEREGCAVDVAIHKPDRGGDNRNHHAHILRTTRRVGTDGLTTKLDTEQAGRKRADDLAAVRARWAELVNEHLAEHGLEARVDHRTLKEQGIDRPATSHLGPAVTAMERRKVRTEVNRLIHEEISDRLIAAYATGKEARALKEALIDTETELQAALAERERMREVAAARVVPDPREQLARFRAAQASAEPVLSADEREKKSRQALTAALADMPDGGYRLFAAPTNVEHGRYSGRLLLSTDLHIAQDVGLLEAVIHERKRLDGNLKADQSVTIQYSGGRATVTPKHDQSLDLGRGRPRLR